MVKAAGKARDDMIIDLVNQITVEHSTIVNCYKGKSDVLERGNYRGLTLTE